MAKEKKKNVFEEMLAGLKSDGVAPLSADGLPCDIEYTCSFGSMVIDALVLNSAELTDGFTDKSLVPFGRWCTISGKSRLGKTTIAAAAIRSLQQAGTSINGHEPIVGVIDTECALSKSWWRTLNVDLDKALMFPLKGTNNTITNVARAINKMIKMRNSIDPKSPMLILFDSIGATNSDTEIENINMEVGTDVKGSYGKARDIGKALMPIKDILAEHNVCVIAVNHLYESMTGRGGMKASGGNRLQHLESLHITLKKPAMGHLLSRTIQGKKVNFGHQVDAVMTKNKIHSPNHIGLRLTIIEDEGVSDAYAVYDTFKSKSWTTPSGEEVKFRNYEEFRAKVVQHPEYLSLYNKVRQDVYKLPAVDKVPYIPGAEITVPDLEEDEGAVA